MSLIPLPDSLLNSNRLWSPKLSRYLVTFMLLNPKSTEWTPLITPFPSWYLPSFLEASRHYCFLPVYWSRLLCVLCWLLLFPLTPCYGGTRAHVPSWTTLTPCMQHTNVDSLQICVSSPLHTGFLLYQTPNFGSNLCAFLSSPPGCLPDASNSRISNELLLLPSKTCFTYSFSRLRWEQIFSAAQVKDFSSVGLCHSSCQQPLLALLKNIPKIQAPHHLCCNLS